MGLRVEPPDVNVSGSDFTVAGEAIHFGLAAIKNVGATAIESIVRTRAGGRPLRQPRRLLRARRSAAGQPAGARVPDQGGRVRLAAEHARRPARRAGPGDGQRPAPAARPRRGAGLPLRRPGRRRRQAGREPRRGGGPASRSGRRRRCWPTRRRCWASTSRAIRSSSYREMARRIGALSAADLAARSIGARVLLLGQVSAFSESTPPRAATAWRSPRSSWWTAALPLTIFPEPYRSCAGALRHKGPVIVRGRTDDSDKGRVVLAEEIKPLEDAMGNLAPVGNGHGNGNGAGNGGASAHACRIRVSAAAESAERAARLGEGGLPRARGPHAAVPPRAPCRSRRSCCGSRSCAVDPAPDLVAKVEGLLGAGQYTRGVCRTSLSSRSRSSSSRTASRSCAPPEEPLEARDEIAKLEERLGAASSSASTAGLTAWQRAQIARHPKRPHTLDLINLLLEDWVELHGDRVFGDDKAIVGGLARFDGEPVVRDRPPEGPRHAREHRAQLRHAAPRGLSQGAPADAARGEVRQAHHHLHRHARRLSRARRRGARPGRGDRAQPAGDGGPRRPRSSAW